MQAAGVVSDVVGLMPDPSLVPDAALVSAMYISGGAEVGDQFDPSEPGSRIMPGAEITLSLLAAVAQSIYSDDIQIGPRQPSKKLLEKSCPILLAVLCKSIVVLFVIVPDGV